MKLTNCLMNDLAIHRYFRPYTAGHDSAITKEFLKDAERQEHHETVMCVTEADIALIRKGENRTVDIICEARPFVEHASNLIQIIAAGCIYNEETRSFIALRLAGRHGVVEGYHGGTYTFPQGHCVLPEGEQGGKWHIDKLMDVLDMNVKRELDEELGYSDIIGQDAADIIATADVYPLYIDTPGSTRRHLCILYMLPTDSVRMRKFKSTEPRKHTVAKLDFAGLCKIPVDDMCLWMRQAFSAVSWFSQQFYVPNYSRHDEKRKRKATRVDDK